MWNCGIVELGKRFIKRYFHPHLLPIFSLAPPEERARVRVREVYLFTRHLEMFLSGVSPLPSPLNVSIRGLKSFGFPTEAFGNDGGVGIRK